MKTFKILGALLTYPQRDLIAALGELSRLLDEENALPAETRATVGSLIGSMTVGDLLSLQEQYVSLFDRNRALSLHLFEHIHGESRDRGQAMVDLSDHYKRHGLEIEANELPDYLPLFLEFLSAIPDDEAAELLGQVAHIIAAIGTRLEKRGCGYAAVFHGLSHLAKGQADETAIAAILAADDEKSDSPEALDEAWEEDPVTFAGAAAGTGCPQAREMLSRIDPPRDAAQPAAPKPSRDAL